MSKEEQQQKITALRRMFFNMWSRVNHSPYYTHVKVCDEWSSFDGFKAWALSQNYKIGDSLARTHDIGDYHKFNCKLVPKKDNSKAGLYLVYNFITQEEEVVHNLSRWCRENNEDYYYMRSASNKPNRTTRDTRYKITKITLH